MNRATRTYAVVWTANGEFGPGRLERFDDRFELYGRDRRLSIPFAELVDVSIVRGQSERLNGLPVLAVERMGAPPVRIASLEGTGALHELFLRIRHASTA